MKLRSIKLFPFVAVLAMALSACAGTQRAYRAADTLEETAVVVSEHFFALQREANDLADQGVLVGDWLDRAQVAEARARPVVLQLRTSVESYEALRSAASEAQLEEALADALPLVASFLNTLRARE